MSLSLSGRWLKRADNTPSYQLDGSMIMMLTGSAKENRLRSSGIRASGHPVSRETILVQRADDS